MGNFLSRFFLCMKNVQIEKWKCGKMTHIFEDFSWYFHVWTSKPRFFCLFIIFQSCMHQTEVIWQCFVHILKSCNPKMFLCGRNMLARVWKSLFWSQHGIIWFSMSVTSSSAISEIKWTKYNIIIVANKYSSIWP